MYNIAMRMIPVIKRRCRSRKPVAGASLLALVLLLVLASLVPAPVLAASGGLKGKLVVLIIDRVGMQDFPTADTPFCLRLAQQWSLGMMVTHTGERENGKELDLGAEYVTLGAGVRSKGTFEQRDSGLAYNSAEAPAGSPQSRTAGDLYARYTDRPAPTGGVVCLSWFQILRRNESAANGQGPGTLGQVLADAGKKTAVLGNADSTIRAVRLSPLICCDRRGVVSAGDVSDDTQIVAPGSPGGYRASEDRLLEESRRLLGTSDALVVDTGDTGRIDRQSASTDPDVLARDRQAALRRTDSLVKETASLLDLDSSLLLIVSPSAPMENRADGDYLTPFIAAGKGFGRGLLTSLSTRRPGLINSIDLLPTVAGYFEAGVPASVVGSTMSTVSRGGDHIGYLRKLDAQFGVTRSARWPIVTTYFFLCAFELCFALLCLPGVNRRFRFPRDARRFAVFTSAAAPVLLAGPLSFIVVSAFHYGGYVFPTLFCAGFSLVIGLGAWFVQKGRPRMNPAVTVCLLTVAVFVVDAFFGGRLLIVPLLGVSALEGFRLYGLSNALTGVLLGTGIWGIAGLAGDGALDRGSLRYWAFAAMVGLAFVIGFGKLGADAGGFVAALATALIFLFATSRRPFTGARALAVAGITAAGTAAMIVLDSAFVHSHTGKVLSGTAGSLTALVQRKLAIQFSQIGLVLLPAVLLIAVTVAAVLWMRKPGSFWRWRWEEERLQTATLFSLVVGSLVALVFNDTGLVMLGTMTTVSVLMMCYYLCTAAAAGPEEEPGARSAPGIE